jgi:hypothetical protein
VNVLVHDLPGFGKPVVGGQIDQPFVHKLVVLTIEGLNNIRNDA